MGKYKWLEVVKKVGEEEGVDYRLIYAIILRESGEINEALRFEYKFYEIYMKKKGIEFKEKIMQSISYGLMQIMGSTARMYGFKGEYEELLDPEVNIRIGAKILKDLIKKYNGELKYVISAYNCGNCWKEYQEGKNPRNMNYVNMVMAFYNLLRKEI